MIMLSFLSCNAFVKSIFIKCNYLLSEYRMTGFTFYDESGHVVSVDNDMLDRFKFLFNYSVNLVVYVYLNISVVSGSEDLYKTSWVGFESLWIDQGLKLSARF